MSAPSTDTRQPILRFFSGLGQVIHTVAYALWLGGVIGIGAFVAPSAFDFTRNMPQLYGNTALQTAIAGGIIGTSLKGFNILTYIAGLAMLFADTFESVGGHGVRFRLLILIRSVLTVLLLAIAIYLGFHVMPEMNHAGVRGTTLFDALHHEYENLTWLQIPILLLIPVITAWRNEAFKRP